MLEVIAESTEEHNRSLKAEISRSYTEYAYGINKSSPPKSFQLSSDSPEVLRKGSPGAPSYVPENLLGDHSLSLEDSGTGNIGPSLPLTPPSLLQHIDPSLHLTPPSPMQHIDPLLPLTPPSPMQHMDPSFQNISGITSRFDIGRSLNMHTVHSGSPSPYKQLTRVDSIVSPQPGPSRMLDSPLRVQHRASFTSPGYTTPWISTQSRYGYTDPSYRVLNIPPGAFVEMNTALKKKLMLTSPKREEPLLVNIDIDPKPLVETESGEHFICDISLDVQQAGKANPPRVSPVYTYGIPPAVTPTDNRRRGLFTPPGIFQKQHFNLRMLEEEFDDSPGRYFQPHYLPHEGRSPVSHLSPVSLLSDRTISWERIPGYERTPSPVIKGPSWAYPGYIPSPLTDSSPEESPVIKGRIDLSSTDYSDSSFERTPPSLRLDETFERSMSPLMNRTFERSQSPGTNGSFERSPSPRLGATFERSPSPMIRGIVDMSSSPSTDESFDRTPSPRLGGTFERSSSPMIRGIVDMSSSPSTDGSFDRTPSPRLGGTFERSPSPMIRGIVDMSSSPSTDGSFDRTPYPRLDGSFGRSPSPLSRVHRFTGDGRGYLDMTSSFSNDESFDRSASRLSNRTFERSPSPVLNRTFENGGQHMYGPSVDEFSRSMDPSNGSFSHSMSPRTYDSDMSSSGYTNPFNPNNSVLSPSGLSPHILNSSMPPRLGGVFNENPSRLTRTV